MTDNLILAIVKFGKGRGLGKQKKIKHPYTYDGISIAKLRTCS